MEHTTALSAATKKNDNLVFISEAHEKFYYEKLTEVRYQDEYHKALIYHLKNIHSVFQMMQKWKKRQKA